MDQTIFHIDALKSCAEGADHIDVKTIESREELPAFAAGLLSYAPWWLKTLYAIRSVLIRVLGIPQTEESLVQYDMTSFPMKAGEEAAFFTVKSAKEGEHWLAGITESHLTAHIAIVQENLPSGMYRYHVITIVHFHTFSGRVYFQVIRPFHHIVVWQMALSAAKNPHAPSLFRRHAGHLLMGIAIVHNVLGVFIFSKILRDILFAGVWNSIQLNPMRNVAFWFLATGVMMYLYGSLVQWAFEQNQTLPSSAGWGFLLFCLFGVFLIPESGFWTGLPVAYLMIRSSGATRASSEQIVHPTPSSTH
ncbi:MAG TPA: hypothetical protein DCE42_22895 [Myxococcales bacterium]|nr:hypothetical protein [Deltaproteobacteria bacterium]HAA57633.1 hypothetical protein [Myxococcales bacterium]|tara:strand:+ start:3274 stop:4188 length:915 start_codon:yes stop_codon:yes gene_type:complete